MDGVPFSKTFHSLRFPCWNSDNDGYYRDISHVNPMRKELAIQASMEGSAGEDSRWSERMRDLKIVKTEHYIDAIMYFYYWRSSKNDGVPPVPQSQIVQSVPLKFARCPQCGSTACGMAGGMRNCNQCSHRWL